MSDSYSLRVAELMGIKPIPDEDRAALLAAGFSKEEFEKWIVPLSRSSPCMRRDPDGEGYLWDDEPVDNSEFLYVECSFDFELYSNYAPTFDLRKLYQRKDLTEDTSALIGKILFNNHQLTNLDVETKGVDAKIVFAFFRHWEGKDCRLQCLNLDYLRIGVGRFKQFIQRLLCHNDKLMELRLTNRVSALENAKELASVLSSGPSSLKHLSLMNDFIDDEGVTAISEAVCAMPNMETIDLRGNFVPSVRCIAKMLHDAPKLRKITLRYDLGKAPIEKCRKFVDYLIASLQKETDQWEYEWRGVDLILTKRKVGSDAQTGKRKRSEN